ISTQICTTCGAAAGQPCCNGTTCTGANLACNTTSRVCYSCGGLGQPCCSNACPLGTAAQPLYCSANTCTACGANGQICCSGAVTPAGTNCTSPLSCNSTNRCTSCGGIGQPCCAGSRCNSQSGVVCQSGTCRACGSAIGQPCCGSDYGVPVSAPYGSCTGLFGSAVCYRAGGSSCSYSTSYSDNTCVPCGQPGQPCCGPVGGGGCYYGWGSSGALSSSGTGCFSTCGVPATCDSGAVCQGSPSFLCATCGGSGQPCCAASPGPQCTASFHTCSSGTCIPCGATYQSLCPTAPYCSGTNVPNGGICWPQCTEGTISPAGCFCGSLRTSGYCCFNSAGNILYTPSTPCCTPSGWGQNCICGITPVSGSTNWCYNDQNIVPDCADSTAITSACKCGSTYATNGYCCSGTWRATECPCGDYNQPCCASLLWNGWYGCYAAYAGCVHPPGATSGGGTCLSGNAGSGGATPATAGPCGSSSRFCYWYGCNPLYDKCTP
ncbi:MAG: hypothetical protein WCT52_06180, partial [Candidatus Micrarchaeia archaeon]